MQRYSNAVAGIIEIVDKDKMRESIAGHPTGALGAKISREDAQSGMSTRRFKLWHTCWNTIQRRGPSFAPDMPCGSCHD